MARPRTRHGTWIYVVAMVAIGDAASANGRLPGANEIVVDPADDMHIAVRTTFGLANSFDSGASWAWICESAIDRQGFTDPTIVIAADGRTLVGLPEGVGVGSRSGCEWEIEPVGSPEASVIDLALDRSDPSRAYGILSATNAGAFEADVMRTEDGGRSWSPAGAPIAGAFPITIEVAPSRPSRLYLGADDGNLQNGFILVSDDDAATWVWNQAPAGPDSVYVSGIDPGSADRVYVRTYSPGGDLYVSEDGAITWTKIYSSPTALIGFAISPDGRRIAVGNDDGIAILSRSDSDGGTSSYAVVSRSPTRIGCLSWNHTGLYACGSESNGSFSVGLSRDGSMPFVSLLRFTELLPIACPENAFLAACAVPPCQLATLFDASCGFRAESGADDASTEVAGSPDDGSIDAPPTFALDGGPNAGAAPASASVVTTPGCACRATGRSGPARHKIPVALLFLLTCGTLHIARARRASALPRVASRPKSRL